MACKKASAGIEQKYPKGERVWVGYYDSSDTMRFFITSKETRDVYYLYECKDGGYVRLGKAKEPPVLIEKYKVMERIRE